MFPASDMACGATLSKVWRKEPCGRGALCRGGRGECLDSLSWSRARLPPGVNVSQSSAANRLDGPPRQAMNSARASDSSTYSKLRRKHRGKGAVVV